MVRAERLTFLLVAILEEDIVVDGEEFHKLAQILKVGFRFQDHFFMRAEEREVVLLLFRLSLYLFFRFIHVI